MNPISWKTLALAAATVPLAPFCCERGMAIAIPPGLVAPGTSNIRAATTALSATTLTGSVPRCALNPDVTPSSLLSRSASGPRVSLSRIALFFEVNEGQTAPQVKFLSRTPGSTLFLTGSDAVVTLHRPAASSPKRDRRGKTPSGISCGISSSVCLHLVGSAAHPVVTGEEEQQGKSNYFIGNNPKKWRMNIANFARVRMKNVYPGVDMEYYGHQNNSGETLEHDFVVVPGASVSSIRMRVDGGNQKLTLNGTGALEVRTPAGELTLGKPAVYQQVNGTRKQVPGRYEVRGTEVSFRVGVYDHRKPLVIDPLIYSTYLGGSGPHGDFEWGIAVDSAGNAYVAGQTSSADFPVTAGAFQAQLKSPGNDNAFVTKLNASGTGLVYSTYLGGSGAFGNVSNAIVIDSAGNAYVAGYTSSADFPVTSGAFQTTLKGFEDAFVTKLNATGGGLVYST